MKSGFEALGRMRLQAILLLAAVFVIGLLCGAAIERARQKSGPPPRPGGPRPREHGELPRGLTEELRLTADQEVRIQAIFERYRPRTDAVLDEFFPRLRAVTDSARAEIRALLTPEQQEIFDRNLPADFGEGGRPPFGGGPPSGGPWRGDRRFGPPGGPRPGAPGSAGGRHPPAGPPPADRDSTGEQPPHEAGPR